MRGCNARPPDGSSLQRSRAPPRAHPAQLPRLRARVVGPQEHGGVRVGKRLARDGRRQQLHVLRRLRPGWRQRSVQERVRHHPLRAGAGSRQQAAACMPCSQHSHRGPPQPQRRRRSAAARLRGVHHVAEAQAGALHRQLSNEALHGRTQVLLGRLHTRSARVGGLVGVGAGRRVSAQRGRPARQPARCGANTAGRAQRREGWGSRFCRPTRAAYAPPLLPACRPCASADAS